MKHTINNIDDYHSLFQSVSGEKAIGEASTAYLYSTKAIERIKHYIPNVKVIAILRDPVERAYSNFLHLVRDGREPFSNFRKALEEESNRRINSWGWGWRYLDRGFYYSQLKEWFTNFSESQIKIYLYEDLCEDPAGLLTNICDFLDIDNKIIFDTSRRYNISSIPKSNTLHAYMKSSHLIKNVLRLFLPPIIRQQISKKLLEFTWASRRFLSN